MTRSDVVDLRRLLLPFGIEAPSIGVAQMILDSREVAIHNLFVAVKGHHQDGRDFIPQAVSLGAKAILAQADKPEQHGQVEMREQSLIIHFYRLSECLSALAAEFYQHPADKLKVAAVTGTNGKTSTVQLIAQLARLTGEQAGTIGTLGAGMQGQLQEVANTTPDAISMHKLLCEMQLQGAQMVALEASSHALVQHRIASIKTDVVVFTNLTRDHLDYHGDMNQYAAAKRMLLNQPGLRAMVLNQQDPESENWLAVGGHRLHSVFCGLKSPHYPEHDHVIAAKVDYLPQGTRIDIESSWGNGQVMSPLMGQFNVLNLLGALATQLILGAELKSLMESVPQLAPVPGRLEVFHRAGHGALVVDYAHTPDALEQALVALRQHARGKLYCLFGCGGDRDKGKRPLMGRVAEASADVVMITNDNSRSEDPHRIAEDILGGMQQPDKALLELDRQAAIRRLFEQADDGDLILLAGKGHEPYQVIGNNKINYNEREFAATLIKRNCA
ncbi:UDP-N-acetylmuramoyl-L-alanyl-D-glutamate--2,6-diaminopimelate ligase [Lacimicrobium alkaliphilum]|uniref:UDP-N-acetylmuramyl-tripeptide synthetase n=1 Tax=Lacimicrobium alkaliphilum TaxID=1526571 RepID=A0ABQ1QZB5_9ALTE|nr:UDP-N-acetylmuramoyl-L-alanyl-D-glutamate--2,6-diaminopimelate ligase [Lacimicrobium alkaliphilum]GGD50966.1 UDP-N-acetylmuramoyl-L-alanyl-D-glutamate--2,6-diaminopimelate ligase [Lacimicrobium alkaliphilum]